MKRAWFGGLAAALCAMASPCWAGPAVASRYQIADMPQQQCLERAEAAVKQIYDRANKPESERKIDRTEQSRYGTYGSYTGVVRCVTENKIVVFIGSGPERGSADGLAGRLFENWTAAK